MVASRASSKKVADNHPATLFRRSQILPAAREKTGINEKDSTRQVSPSVIPAEIAQLGVPAWVVAKIKKRPTLKRKVVKAKLEGVMDAHTKGGLMAIARPAPNATDFGRESRLQISQVKQGASEPANTVKMIEQV